MKIHFHTFLNRQDFQIPFCRSFFVPQSRETNQNPPLESFKAKVQKSLFLPILFFLCLGAGLLNAEWSFAQESAPSETIPGIHEETEQTNVSRFYQMANFEPELWPIPQPPAYGQACKSERLSKPQDEHLSVLCHFTDAKGPEYLSIGTPFFVKRQGFFVGVRLKTELLDEKTGEFAEANFPVCVRLVDPSGEWHQVRCTSMKGGWKIAEAKSTEPFWDGDGDGVLQFPCSIEYVVVDRGSPLVPRTVRVTLFEVRLFQCSSLPEVLTLNEVQRSWETEMEGGETEISLRETEAEGSGTETGKTETGKTGAGRGTEAGRGTADAALSHLAASHVFLPENAPKAAEFQVQFAKEFAGQPVKLNWKRFQNGQFTESGSILLNSKKDSEAEKQGNPAELNLPKSKEAVEFANAAESAFTMPLTNETGFESLIFTPELTNPAYRKTPFGKPLKFSYSVLPQISARTDWLGICTHYSHGWNLRTLDFLPPGGFVFLRDEASWGACEREKGKYVFQEKWDAYVNRALELGVRPLIILDYGNRNYDGGDFPHSEDAIEGFANYCRALAEHFKGRVFHYEVWNEWTGGCGMADFRENGFNSPENYVRLIERASKALREVDPRIVIVGGGGDHHTWHFEEIEKMMRLGVMKHCDAFSVHPYIYPTTPEKANAVEGIQKVLDCMKANGCENPKLWLTELGWPTHLGGQAQGFASQEAAIREDLQAQMFVRSAITYRAISGVEKFFWYDLKNDGTDYSYNENNFGIIHHDTWNFQPKAAFSAAAAVSRILAEAESVTLSTRLSNADLMVYEVRKKGETAPFAYAAWTLSKETQKISFPEEVQIREVRGTYGEILSAEKREAAERPVFFLTEPW